MQHITLQNITFVIHNIASLLNKEVTMPYRLTRLYTRQGDEGYTHLAGDRYSKDDLLIEALGTIDELNAAIGFIVSLPIQDLAIKETLHLIQHQLFDMGGELHVKEHIVITAEKITQLEHYIDQWNRSLPPLKEFLLPQGNPSSAAAHIARTICRRAERCMVRLHRQISLANTCMLSYLNRLSDLLFVIARLLARETMATEILWNNKR